MDNKFQKKAMLKNILADGKGGPGDREIMKKMPDSMSGERDSNAWKNLTPAGQGPTWEKIGKAPLPKFKEDAKPKLKPMITKGTGVVQWSPADAGSKAARASKIEALKKSAGEKAAAASEAGSRKGLLRETLKGAAAKGGKAVAKHLATS